MRKQAWRDDGEIGHKKISILTTQTNLRFFTWSVHGQRGLTGTGLNGLISRNHSRAAAASGQNRGHRARDTTRAQIEKRSAH